MATPQGQTPATTQPAAQDAAGKARQEIHELERQLQRAIEKRETLKLMISQIELEEHDLSIKLKNKKVEFRKLVASKEAASSLSSAADDGTGTGMGSGGGSGDGKGAAQRARGVIGSVNEFHHLSDIIPPIPVLPLVDSMSEVRRIEGPETEATVAWEPHVAARTVSTYPLVAGGSRRQGSPICDRYQVEVTNGRFLIGVADGCNWGERALDAARRATRSFVAHMSLNHSKVTIARDAGMMLLDAFAHAHNEIIAGKKDIWEAGTTTLIGGIVFPLATKDRRSMSLCGGAAPAATAAADILALTSSESGTSPPSAGNSTGGGGGGGTAGKRASGKTSPLKAKSRSSSLSNGANGPREFGVCLLSIGDCKCFLWDCRTRRIRDITAGNRGNLTDATDPGGRIGPYADAGLPDTRNLTLFFAKCTAGDLLVFCTDGVHDNLDPTSLGIEPEELAPGDFKGMTWDQASEANRPLAESIKTTFMETRLEGLIGDQLEQKLKAVAEATESTSGGVPAAVPTATQVVDSVLEYALRTTSKSRDFMESNPSKKLPKDFKTYPGKMDHTTCVVVRVDYPVEDGGALEVPSDV